MKETLHLIMRMNIEYDFTKATNSTNFGVNKILMLKIEKTILSKLSPFLSTNN